MVTLNSKEYKPFEGIKVITICGSMKFSKEMMKISEELELKEGYAVIQCVYSIDGQKYEGFDAEMLDKIHRKKIDISDAIYVVNIGGYIGDSTKGEIEYAKSIGKEILFLEALDCEKIKVIEREEIRKLRESNKKLMLDE